MRLLVAEDQEHVLRLERMVLITDGFDVEIAAGGREAVEKLKSRRYDEIVLDMLMPDMDGCEIVRHLKAAGPSRQTPVIMVTASPEPGMRQRAFEAGVAAFLNKPFTAEAFRSVIHSAISPPPQPSVAPMPAALPTPTPPVSAPPARTPAPPAPARPAPAPGSREAVRSRSMKLTRSAAPGRAGRVRGSTGSGAGRCGRSAAIRRRSRNCGCGTTVSASMPR